MCVNQWYLKYGNKSGKQLAWVLSATPSWSSFPPLLNIDLKKISEEHQVSLIFPIQIQEVYNAIQTLNSNKAPRPDGFTIEFYAKFMYQLGGYLQFLAQVCIDEGNVPAT